ncbi:hypothetical protein TWF696_005713 [Orbilia brochopaga]|uniref:Uncharacterized protein n=1 Tax=Orbilia brochopaga TaxID=3140254 RepID=A0AAV9UWF5_9PEZI
MAFDGPYPSHSCSMEQVILNALSCPIHEDLIVDVASSNRSPRKPMKTRFPQYLCGWIRSSPVLRRIRSLRRQSDTPSISNCSSISMPSTAVNEIFTQLPEGNGSMGQLAKSIHNMDKRVTRSVATDSTDSRSLTEVSCMSRCGSLRTPFGCGYAEPSTVDVQAVAIGFSPARGVRGYRSVAGAGTREKRAVKVKKRYLECPDGIWDTVDGVFIPNAWPVGRLKTTVKNPRVDQRRMLRA